MASVVAGSDSEKLIGITTVFIHESIRNNTFHENNPNDETGGYKSKKTSDFQSPGNVFRPRMRVFQNFLGQTFFGIRRFFPKILGNSIDEVAILLPAKLC